MTDLLRIDVDGEQRTLVEFARQTLDGWTDGPLASPDLEAAVILLAPIYVQSMEPQVLAPACGMPFRCADALVRRAYRTGIWPERGVMAYEWLDYTADEHPEALWWVAFGMQVEHLLGAVDGRRNAEGRWEYSARADRRRVAPFADVVRLLAEGLSQQQVAAKLGCSPFPVWCAINRDV